ncbi:hypothetical protein QF027_000223 [Streptomyces canus]|nr:hypothetical protein [Streptomyces canus]
MGETEREVVLVLYGRTGQAADDGTCAEDQVGGRDGRWVGRGTDHYEPARRGQAADQRVHGGTAGRRGNDDGGAAQVAQRGTWVGGAAVDVLVGAQLPGENLLLLSSRHRGDPVSETVRVLQGQMSQAADALHGDQ